MTHTLPEFLLHWAERTPDAVVRHGAGPRPHVDVRPGRGIRRALSRPAARSRRRPWRPRGDPRPTTAASGSSPTSARSPTAPSRCRSTPGMPRATSTGCSIGVDPVAVVGDPPYLARLSDRHRDRLVASADVDVTARPAPALDGSDARPAEVGVLCYTSGTTGEPRGVMVRNESLVRNAGMFAHIFQSGPDSATAVVCPLFHNTGYNDGLAHMLLANGRVDVPRRFDPGADRLRPGGGPVHVPDRRADDLRPHAAPARGHSAVPGLGAVARVRRRAHARSAGRRAWTRSFLAFGSSTSTACRRRRP